MAGHGDRAAASCCGAADAPVVLGDGPAAGEGGARTRGGRRGGPCRPARAGAGGGQGRAFRPVGVSPHAAPEGPPARDPAPWRQACRGVSFFNMPLICSRSCGLSSWPWTDAACSAAARTTSSSSPLMVSVQPDSLGMSRQSATLRIGAPFPRGRPYKAARPHPSTLDLTWEDVGDRSTGRAADDVLKAVPVGAAPVRAAAGGAPGEGVVGAAGALLEE